MSAHQILPQIALLCCDGGKRYDDRNKKEVYTMKCFEVFLCFGLGLQIRQNTLMPKQDSPHIANYKFKYILLSKGYYILIDNSIQRVRNAGLVRR